MNLYSHYIFPWFLDKAMSHPSFTKKRKEVLSEAKGKVLEIGLGTGLNIPCYPKNIKHITTVDVNPGMNRYAKKRAMDSSKTIDHKVITAEKLPMPDGTFDTVVTTWTLCSILEVDQTLEEIYRVLKPGGKFIFLEHGLSRNKKIKKWQHRITPFWKVIGDGCHLDRDIKKLILAHKFELKAYKEFDMPKMGKIASHMYQGCAFKE